MIPFFAAAVVVAAAAAVVAELHARARGGVVAPAGEEDVVDYLASGEKLAEALRASLSAAVDSSWLCLRSNASPG